MGQQSLFDLLGDKYKAQKNNKWKLFTSKDYPKQSDGLAVFSCFACGGGGQRWVIN